MCCWVISPLLWFLLFSMCYSLHVAVNVCINCSFLYLLTTFLRGTVWSGQVSKKGQKLKKIFKNKKIDTVVDNFTYMGTRHTELIITKFGVRGLVADVITGDKFCRDRLRVFRSVGVRKWGSPIDLGSRPYNRSALLCCLWWEGVSTAARSCHTHCLPTKLLWGLKVWHMAVGLQAFELFNHC